jgi:hypothetical protein
MLFAKVKRLLKSLFRFPQVSLRYMQLADQIQSKVPSAPIFLQG